MGSNIDGPALGVTHRYDGRFTLDCRVRLAEHEIDIMVTVETPKLCAVLAANALQYVTADGRTGEFTFNEKNPGHKFRVRMLDKESLTEGNNMTGERGLKLLDYHGLELRNRFFREAD